MVRFFNWVHVCVLVLCPQKVDSEVLAGTQAPHRRGLVTSGRDGRPAVGFPFVRPQLAAQNNTCQMETTCSCMTRSMLRFLSFIGGDWSVKPWSSEAAYFEVIADPSSAYPRPSRLVDVSSADNTYLVDNQYWSYYLFTWPHILVKETVAKVFIHRQRMCRWIIASSRPTDVQTVGRPTTLKVQEFSTVRTVHTSE